MPQRYNYLTIREQLFVGYEEKKFLSITIASIQQREINHQVNGPSSNSLSHAFVDGWHMVHQGNISFSVHIRN